MAYLTYTQRALKGFTVVFTVNIIAAFIGYLIRIVLARNLTIAEYGLFFAVFTLINFLAIFNNLGMGQAIVKYIPDFLVKKKQDKITSTVLITIGVHIATFVILGILLLIFADFLAINYFKTRLAVPILLLFILVMLFSNLRTLLRSIYQAFQRMSTFALIYLAENIIVLILLLVFFLFQKNIFLVIYAHIAAYVIVLIIFSLLLFHVFKFFKHKLARKKELKQLTKKLFKFGIPVMLMGIGSIVILYTDTLVLTYFRSLTEVGIYNVVVPTVMMLMFFGKSIQSVIFPMTSELWARKKKKYLEKGLVMLEKYSFVIIIPAALIVLAFAKIFLTLLFGPQYAIGAATMQILIVGVIFLAIYTINSGIFSAIGKPEVATKILLQGALINFVLNLLVIPKLGMLGAGITSLITYLYVFIVSVIKLRRFIKVSIPWLNWIKTFGAGLLMLVSMFILKIVLFNINIYLEIIIICAVAGIVYSALILLMKVIEIKELKQIINKHVPFIRV